MAAGAARRVRGWVAAARWREAPCAPGADAGAPSVAPLGGRGPPPRAGIGPNRWPREPARPSPPLPGGAAREREGGREGRRPARAGLLRPRVPAVSPASGAEERPGRGDGGACVSAGSPGPARPRARVLGRERSLGAAGAARGSLGLRDCPVCGAPAGGGGGWEARRKAACPGTGAGSSPAGAGQCCPSQFHVPGSCPPAPPRITFPFQALL